MKPILLFIVSLYSLTLTSCGGNQDARAFCHCIKNRAEPACEEDMERLIEVYISDPERYDEFKEAAMKICPDEERNINKMNRKH
jgi:hypothetical protein